MHPKLAFIGAGNMAEAIARGAIASGVLRADQLIAADPAVARRELFASIGIHAVESNRDAARNAETVMLCTKPQRMVEALAELQPVLNDSQLLVSIAAGISTDFIARQLGARRWRVVRVMPNTPMLFALGASAICPGRHATPNDLSSVRRLFEAASIVVDVGEEQMDAVTALSGSGPAYFFFLAEQMIAAGVEQGLAPEQSRQLVYRTAAGAAKMLIESSDDPAELRRKVTSPGGTTQAAFDVLLGANIDQTIRQAIAAARRRGSELGQ